MAKLLHFVKKNPTAVGPSEFVYIAEDDGKEAISEYERDGYEMAGEINIDEDELGGFPTERELSP